MLVDILGSNFLLAISIVSMAISTIVSGSVSKTMMTISV